MKINRQVFFSSYRNNFGTLSPNQMNGLEILLSSAEADPLISNPLWFVYMLATIKHECADTFMPITERGQRTYFDKYESGTPIGLRLGNINPGDGFLFRGRGFVQITGRTNYQRMTAALHLIGQDDLITFPDRALFPGIAYKIMSYGMVNGSFTGKKLNDYINSSQTDYFQARRIINALDQADKIQGYAINFESILKGSLLPETITAGVAETSGTPAGLSQDEKDELFENNVNEINKMNISAGSLIKDLIMELERDNRNTYIKLHDAVPDGHVVHYTLATGDQNLVTNIAHALGFKNVTGELLEVQDA